MYLLFIHKIFTINKYLDENSWKQMKLNLLVNNKLVIYTLQNVLKKISERKC